MHDRCLPFVFEIYNVYTCVLITRVAPWQRGDSQWNTPAAPPQSMNVFCFVFYFLFFFFLVTEMLIALHPFNQRGHKYSQSFKFVSRIFCCRLLLPLQLLLLCMSLVSVCCLVAKLISMVDRRHRKHNQIRLCSLYECTQNVFDYL